MRLKRAFAVILAIAMVFGAVSMASAAKPIVGGFADAAEHKQADQIAYLKATGVALGDENGNFNPDSLLTRQEFVTFVARLAGQEEAAAFMAGIPSRYLDDDEIADWARGFVNLADTNGWVQGYDDGKFHPTDNLTYAQAVTVLIRVLGHEAVVTGAWPNAHIVRGINIGLNEGVSLSANTPITRGDMGRLLYNALFIEQLEPAGDGKWEKGDSLMADRTAEGDVTSVTSSNIIVDGLGQREFADEVTLIGVNSFAALQGLNVRVTTDASDISKANAKVTVVEVIDATASGTKVVKEVKAVNDASTGFEWKNFIFFKDGSRVEYDGDTTFSLNGSAPVKIGGTYNDTDPEEHDIAEILEEGDWVVATESGGVAKHLLLTVFRHGEIDDILDEDGVEQTKSDDKDAIKGDSAGTVATKGATITLNGQGATVTDLKEGDIVSIAYRQNWEVDTTHGAYNPNDDTTWKWRFVDATDDDGDFVAHYVLATRVTVKGSVESNRSVTTSKGTTLYTKVKLADGSIKEYAWAAVPGNVPAVDSEVTLMLNADDKIVTIDGGKAAVAHNSFAKFISIAESGSTYTVTLDVNGTEHTLTVDKDAAVGNDPVNDDIRTDHIGEVVQVSLAGTQVDGLAKLANQKVSAKDYEVMAVDGSNITVREDGGSATFLIVDALVYKNDGGKAGAATSVKKGDKVKVGFVGVGVDPAGGETVFMVLK